MADTATLQAWLADCEAALQQLATGAKAVQVEYAMGDGSRKVTYSPANIPALRQRIIELRAQLAAAGVPGYARRRAIGVRF